LVGPSHGWTRFRIVPKAVRNQEFLMNHYVRFVRSLALTGSIVACGAGDDQQTTKQPQTAGEKTPVANADLGAAKDGGATDQATADAAALSDAQANGRAPSGPLAPPELPIGFAA
jgi:hypothetical protein